MFRTIGDPVSLWGVPASCGGAAAARRARAGGRVNPDEAIYAEMAVMAARAAERAKEEKRDNQRVRMMAPRHRLEYRRIRWEAVNAVRISGMPPQRIEEEYRAFGFAQWEQQNAERVAPMSPGERQEMFRAEEMLTRYRAGLPPRDDEERETYREWRQLDADAVNTYREEVEIPEQLWDEHVQNNGPLSREEYFADLTEERVAGDAAEPSRSEPQSAPEADVAEHAEPSSGPVGAAVEVSSELVDADSSPGPVRKLPGPAGVSRSGKRPRRRAHDVAPRWTVRFQAEKVTWKSGRHGRTRDAILGPLIM